MPDIVTLTEYLFWTTIAGYAVLYLRLRQQGLHRTYRIFAIFLLFRVAHTVVLSALPPVWYALHHVPSPPFGANNVYAWTWVFTVPQLWLLHVLVVLELYSLVLKGYKGIASLGRWAILAGLAIAVLISSVTLSAEMAHSNVQQYPILRFMFIMGRDVSSSLVLFLLFITAFLVWFPVPLSRNVVVYSTVYAFYFTIGALGNLTSNLSSPVIRDVVKAGSVLSDLLCVAIWIALLNRAGEAKKVVVRHAWAPQQEEVLLQQLAAINKTLMRSARTK